MKGFWYLLCVLMMFAAIVLMLASAGTTDYALMKQGVKQPESAKTMAWIAVALMMPGAFTLACRVLVNDYVRTNRKNRRA